MLAPLFLFRLRSILFKRAFWVALMKSFQVKLHNQIAQKKEEKKHAVVCR